MRRIALLASLTIVMSGCAAEVNVGDSPRDDSCFIFCGGDQEVRHEVDLAPIFWMVGLIGLVVIVVAIALAGGREREGQQQQQQVIVQVKERE